jgi:hypothetical protein
MGIENPGRGLERQEQMSPEDVLKYAEQMGKDLQQYALQALAMIAEARERGTAIDLSQNQNLKKFEPLGEHEVALIRIRSDLNRVSSDLFEQGVKMTKGDLDARLAKMSSS